MLLEKINEASTQLVRALQEEFEEQGHNASGQGLQSIKHRTEVNGHNINVKIFGVDYLQYVNDGRRAGIMPPVDAIEEWVRIRNIGAGEDQRQIAWAIAKAIEREGIPTAGSYDYTNNGRRKGFIDHVQKERMDSLLQLFRRALIDSFREELVKKVMTA